MHHMGAGAEPQRHAVGLDFRRHALQRHEGAVENHAARCRGNVPRHRGAQAGADAIRRDQCCPLRAGPLGEGEADAVAGIRDAGGTPARVELDCKVAPGGSEEAGQKVGPMADAVGRAEALLEGLAEPDALQDGA